eukprot:gene7626-8921_t
MEHAIHHYQNPKGKWSPEERSVRVTLAAAYRIAAMLGWDELIYNHLTVRVPGTEHILLNPFGLAFDEITASSLVKIDLDGNMIDPGTTEYGINRTGYVIHAAIHKARPDISSTMHTHPTAGVAVASMKCGLLPFCQNIMICGDIKYHDYEGISINEEEQVRIVEDLGPTAKNMILHNHGLLSCGETIQEAFFNLFELTKACEIQVATLSAVGGDVSKIIMPSEERIAQAKVVSQMFSRAGMGVREFDAMLRRIDRMDQSYKN